MANCLWEGSLVEIKNGEELESWLRTQPREVAVAIAARAALRVLPVIQREVRTGSVDQLGDIVLRIFRATAVSWAAASGVAAKYPAHETEFRARRAADAAADAANGTAPASAVRVAAAAAYAAASVAPVDALSYALEAADAAARAAADTAGAAAGAARTTFIIFAEVLADAAAKASAAFWSAFSADAARMKDGAAASDLAGLPLWPQNRPDVLGSLWQELKAALHADNQNWEVWTAWYDRRLAGSMRKEERELAYAWIGDALWAQGPAAVNAQIKRQIKRRRRSRKEAEPTQEPEPPRTPLPLPSPATRFVVQQGIVDVVPPTAWEGREAQFAAYHAKARTIALDLADRLANTDAAPEVAGSVNALLEVLGENATDVQPDQLRLASRTIVARARAYAHPSARWELSAESVSALLELADLLVDLQAFARPELEKHERAIRALDLTEATAAEAKERLDLMSEAIASAPEIASDRAVTAFDASSTASANAADKAVQITIEGDRILLAENLALALARHLGSPAVQESAPSLPALQIEGSEHSKNLPREQPKSRRKSPPKRPSQKTSSADFVDRIMARLDKKGPDAIADALLSAATSTIKHSPKSIPGLAALVYANFIGSQVLLATGGAFSLTLAWIGYELWRRKN